MEYQWIQEFLSSPQLPDVISYVFLIVAFIGQLFVKRFVKRDNVFTTLKIDKKIDKLKEMQSNLDLSDHNHKKERAQWEIEKEQIKKEREALIEEIETLKKAVRVCASNVQDLVKNGISNTIAKMLPVKEGEEITSLCTDVEEIEKKEITNSEEQK